MSTCGCRLGADNNFEKEVAKQQENLDVKRRVMNHLGLKDEEYDLFLPILKDVILNIFTDKNEEKIFLKALRGMNNKFPDTLNGFKKQCLFFLRNLITIQG